MKATLEFNLPDEASEHIAAVHALDWKYVIIEIDEYLRSSINYGEHSIEVTQAFQSIHDELRQLCTDNNLDITS